VWSDPEVETVLPGVHRVPLPLPGDALKAINVYLIEDPDGYTLVDSGWDSTLAWDSLTDGLAMAGADARAVRRILVTHVHRDHVGQATRLARESGAEVWIGENERRTYRSWVGDISDMVASQRAYLLRAGARELVSFMENEFPLPPMPDWDEPRHWTRDGDRVAGNLSAIATPGHTQGHTSFFDSERGLFFPGDHVLPHITPSIGFEGYPLDTALPDFLASLAKVRPLPARLVLPAHGPVFTDLAGRVDELLAHHEHRLDQCLAAVSDAGSTALEVATKLPWTRRERSYDDLDFFNRMLAVWETLAHLLLLRALGKVTGMDAGEEVLFRPKVPG
jgi:glyoxylase-like metal-dependent hydrolase (beta-lactamase superfamily II)